MPLRILAPGPNETEVPRSAYVIVPPNWMDHRPLPVVLGFHGGGGHTALQLANQTRFHEVTRPDLTIGWLGAPPFVTVYPVAWEPDAPELMGSGWNNGWSNPVSFLWEIDDVGFVARLLAILETQMNASAIALGRSPGSALDLDRVYAFGFSSGANFVWKLAADAVTAGFRIKSFCVAASTYAGVRRLGSPLVRNVPRPFAPRASVLLFHGREDTSIPLGGGVHAGNLLQLAHWRGYPYTAGTAPPSVAENLMPYGEPALDGAAAWRVHDGIASTTSIAVPSAPAAWQPFIDAYSNRKAEITVGDNGVEVVATAVADYGHIWPARGSAAIARMVWSFFERPLDFV